MRFSKPQIFNNKHQHKKINKFNNCDSLYIHKISLFFKIIIQQL